MTKETGSARRMKMNPVRMPGEVFNSASQQAQLSMGGVGGGAEGSGPQNFFTACLAWLGGSHLFCHQLSTGSGEYLWPVGQSSRV